MPRARLPSSPKRHVGRVRALQVFCRSVHMSKSGAGMPHWLSATGCPDAPLTAYLRERSISSQPGRSDGGGSSLRTSRSCPRGCCSTSISPSTSQKQPHAHRCGAGARRPRHHHSLLRARREAQARFEALAPTGTRAWATVPGRAVLCRPLTVLLGNGCRPSFTVVAQKGRLTQTQSGRAPIAGRGGAGI